MGDEGRERGGEQGTMATDKVEEAQQCSSGGDSCAALSTSGGVAGGRRVWRLGKRGHVERRQEL